MQGRLERDWRDDRPGLSSPWAGVEVDGSSFDDLPDASISGSPKASSDVGAGALCSLQLFVPRRLRCMHHRAMHAMIFPQQRSVPFSKSGAPSRHSQFDHDGRLKPSA